MGRVRQAGGARSGQVSGWWSESGADCGDSRGRQVGGVKRQQVRVGGVMRQMGGVRRGQQVGGVRREGGSVRKGQQVGGVRRGQVSDRWVESGEDNSWVESGGRG